MLFRYCPPLFYANRETTPHNSDSWIVGAVWGANNFWWIGVLTGLFFGAIILGGTREKLMIRLPVYLFLGLTVVTLGIQLLAAEYLFRYMNQHIDPQWDNDPGFITIIAIRMLGYGILASGSLVILIPLSIKRDKLKKSRQSLA